MAKERILHGFALSDRGAEEAPADARVVMRDPVNGTYFFMTQEQLERSLLVASAPGFGKTVLLLQVAEQLRAQASEDDCFVFFDTKGDYREALFRPGDVVVGGDGSDEWNVYADIFADGRGEDQLYDNAYEIASALMWEKIRQSQQPFFPQNGRDLLTALLYVQSMKGLEDRNVMRARCNNRAFRRFFDERFTVADILRELQDFERVSSVRTSICTGDERASLTPQSQGVLSEAAGVVREVFKGEFAREGRFGMRNFIRERGGRACFIEFDMARAATLEPVYRTLADLALKEALTRRSRDRGGRVYVFYDELRLMPGLQNLGRAIAFGRGMRLTVAAGLQSVHQMEEVYGREAAQTLLGSFGTCVMLNAADADTRRLMADRCGRHLRMESCHRSDGRTEEQTRLADVVEDWHITPLGKGEAIVHTIGQPPFRIQLPNR